MQVHESLSASLNEGTHSTVQLWHVGSTESAGAPQWGVGSSNKDRQKGIWEFYPVMHYFSLVGSNIPKNMEHDACTDATCAWEVFGLVSSGRK